MKEMKICSQYPTAEEDCVCGAGSDISGHSPCTEEDGYLCEWAKRLRRIIEQIK
jgi:hypothetical protein